MFEKGSKARCKGEREVGTVVTASEGTVILEYEHSEGRRTAGVYQVGDVEAVVEAPAPEESSTEGRNEGKAARRKGATQGGE